MSYDQLTADVIKENAELKAKILAQEEELGGLRDIILQRDIQTAKRDDQITKLEAENQALKDESTIVRHMERQRTWSLRTFGHGHRVNGILEHIAKEIAEVMRDPTDIMEWVDIVLLALDGAWRAGYSPTQIAHAIDRKQTINEARDWPDWRLNDGHAIEHLKEPQP